MTVVNRYLRCQWVLNFLEICKASLALKRFVIFIKNQIGKNVKRIHLNQGGKSGVQDLDFWTKEKVIKVEYIVAYCPKIKKTAEPTNSLIAGKAT